MNYYLNEYSLRGQYKDVDDFFDKLRDYTLPALDKIEEEKDSLIWKDSIFWNLPICNGITLMNIPKRKNERCAEKTALQIRLIKLIRQEPYWYEDSDSVCDINIQEYKFDKEYREYFHEPNCFSKALENEGRLLSFFHPDYIVRELPIDILINNCKKEYKLDNIYDKSWWETAPKIINWKELPKYEIQVRAKEFEFHPPHFHVIGKDFQAVFTLEDGRLYRCEGGKWTTQNISEIKNWYIDNKEKLKAAWNSLHKH